MTFYHNPRCSKSREALALCRERGAEPDVVLYLKTPPDLETLRHLAERVEGGLNALTRTADLKKAGLQPTLELLAEQPKFLQRPILVRGERVVVGRPPENVLQLLD